MHKNENRPGYKNSKVGWIPEGWAVVKLGEIGGGIRHAIVDGPFGSNLKSIHYKETGIPVIQSGFVTSDQFKTDKYLYVDQALFDKQKRSAVHGGDIVMAKIGAQAGRCAVMPEEHPTSILAGNCLKITTNKKSFHTDYTCMLLHRAYALSGLAAIKTETAQPAISLKSLKSFYLAYPPLPEQKAIAGVLECWDKGIRNLELKIEKKRLIKNGLMQRLLSGKQRLKGFTEVWKSVRLGDLGKLSKGIGISKDELSEIGIPCIRYGEIYTVHDFVLKEFHSYINPELAAQSIRIKKNDLLFAGSGETAEEIGKSVAYMDDSEAYAGGDVIILSVSSTASRADYLSYYLNTVGREALNRLGQGQSVVHIYPKNLSKVSLALPPLDEQQAIVGILSAADREIESLEKKLALWKEQKKYLLNNLVTGTIRLPQFCVKAKRASK